MLLEWRVRQDGRGRLDAKGQLERATRCERAVRREKATRLERTARHEVEDICILSVLETKFEGREFDYLVQQIVTPTMVAMKIRDVKDNKSPGVDGIPPKFLLEIVEQ